MNGKKAKKLRRLSKVMTVGKPLDETEKVYKRMKSIKPNKK